MADRILESETVVLAREDPSRPFTFAPVAVLRGSVDGKPIPFLVDSTTKRRLGANSEDAVLFVRPQRSPLRPLAPTEPEWLRLAYADAEYRTLIDRILALGDFWRADETGQARFSFFEALYDHKVRAIRELALSELARAPYRLVRGMTPRLAVAEIVRMLRDPAMIPWAPAYVLLLGRSADPAAHVLVRETIAAFAMYGAQSNLAAWATALIEIDGVRGIDILVRHYGGVPERSAEELQEILTAFGVHAKDGDPTLRSMIVARLHDLARARVEVAPAAANHLASLNDWSQADFFQTLLESEKRWSPAESFMLTVYVRAARKGIESKE
ncbi:MAG: hypothetical protein ACFCUQ_16925 [Kiloniellales bacterium]